MYNIPLRKFLPGHVCELSHTVEMTGSKQSATSSSLLSHWSCAVLNSKVELVRCTYTICIVFRATGMHKM